MTPQIGEPAPYICYACANGRHSDCSEEACKCSHRAQPSRPAAPESCEHDNRFKGVFNLPQEDNGCLACALERTARAHALAQTEIKGHMRIAKEAAERAEKSDRRCNVMSACYDADLAEAQARIAALEKDAARLDRGRLCDSFTDIVARALYYFENVGKINVLKTAAEVTAALEGGIDLYLNDSIYHAKVASLVAQLMGVLDAALKDRA